MATMSVHQRLKRCLNSGVRRIRCTSCSDKILRCWAWSDPSVENEDDGDADPATDRRGPRRNRNCDGGGGGMVTKGTDYY